MDLEQIIIYNKKENTVQDILFITLIKWLNTDTDKEAYIKHVTSFTAITEDIVIMFLDSISFDNIVDWSKTEIGKQYIK